MSHIRPFLPVTRRTNRQLQQYHNILYSLFRHSRHWNNENGVVTLREPATGSIALNRIIVHLFGETHVAWHCGNQSNHRNKTHHANTQLVTKFQKFCIAIHLYKIDNLWWDFKYILFYNNIKGFSNVI